MHFVTAVLQVLYVVQLFFSFGFNWGNIQGYFCLWLYDNQLGRLQEITRIPLTNVTARDMALNKAKTEMKISCKGLFWNNLVLMSILRRL